MNNENTLFLIRKQILVMGVPIVGLLLITLLPLSVQAAERGSPGVKGGITFSFGQFERSRPSDFRLCRRYGYQAATAARRARDEDGCPQGRLNARDRELWSVDPDKQALSCLSADNPRRYISRSNERRSQELERCLDKKRKRPRCLDLRGKAVSLLRLARQEGCRSVVREWRSYVDSVERQCMLDPRKASARFERMEKDVERCLRRGNNRRHQDPGEVIAEAIAKGVIGLVFDGIARGGERSRAEGSPPPAPRPSCPSGQVVASDGSCIISVSRASRATIRKDQVCLSMLGFNPGEADGLIGRATRSAVRAYLASRNLHTQNDLYDSARKKLYSECDEKIDMLAKGGVIRNDSFIRGNDSEATDKLTCLSFDDWDAYVQRKINPPLPLCDR